ncbi:hypothetical protein NAP1_00540 [Erythrobacter sp. NAP1]|uniref:CocE/NonD family hydrolase n=1 Tax=Erythrobacter sp. NAP1 TaxID=237727 RepID=UPI0000686E91|nr:CocE/NonD family hydrolase [Erythrobacter sp. NAP1]EAQ29214.1 hypothetical protein NAP1_00540 [Erythrobacter sp. NAP1]
MGRKAKIAIALLVGLTAVGLAGGMFLASKDQAQTFLEDDPQMRTHPDYPVEVTDISGLAEEIEVERDVWITTRDGTRLSANIFRPRAEGRYPVVMAFTAYDKNKGPDLYPKLLRHSLKPDFDLGRIAVSEWTSWEGPDPAFWVPQGYVVIYVDSAGFASSEGEPSTLSRRDRDYFYDAIEWAGEQGWSNGNIGLNGVSYLAISQWVAASGNPPSLKAIIPWEGQSDPYREVLYHGGIPEIAFTSFWIRKMRSGANGAPLPHPIIFKFAHQRPSLMRRVQTRPATTSGIDLQSITVPALIAGTWSDQGLHTRGSFEGFKTISSEKKWLYTHGRSKWDVYYSEEALETQKAFFDHFLKGVPNGFDQTAPVRVEVREDLRNFQVYEAQDWPIPGTDYQSLYLNAQLGELSSSLPAQPREASYDALTGSRTFDLIFDEDTELTGNMKLKLWVSVDEGDDMDLFIGVRKLDRQGREVHFFAKTGYIKGPVAMGWLRASQRELDETRSTPWQPVLLHQDAAPLTPGEIVPVEIEILPSSTLFRAGETLRLVIQGRDLFDHPALAHGYPVNRGQHTVHAGGKYDSHLLVPVIPRQED